MKELYRFRQFLTEEDFKNPILDKYLKLKKSIDNKTVFDYELSDFINNLDNTEREGLESDLGLERDTFYGGRLFEAIDFPELEDEFEGAMDAMVVEPKVYLQDIIDASAEEIVSDDYYEIMNAVEQGVYSEVEAVKLAKAWAKEKLSNLAEGRLLKEDYGKESLIKALGDADDAFIQLGDGREFVIYNPNSNNDDNVDMWGDYSVFAVDKDGEEHEILYSDIAGINL